MDKSQSRKILFVVASLGGGGAERLTVDLANEASKRGFDVTLFVGNFVGPYIEFLSEDLEIVRGKYTKFSKSFFHLRNTISTGKYNYIFCSQEYVISISYLALLFSGYVNDCKFIGREASTPSSNLNQGVRSFILKLIIKAVYLRVDKLIAPTASVKKDIEKFYGLSREIIIANNPIDKEKILTLADIRQDFIEVLPENYIICVGRLVESKRIDTILNAMRNTKVSNFSLVILGDGEQLNHLQRLVHDLSLNDRVFFLGFKQNPFPYIKAARAFVLASSYEGMPNILLQASILNVPCVSSINTSIVKEIVDERFIFKCGDVYALTGLFNKLFVENLTPLNKDYLPLSPEQFLSKVIN